MKKLICLLLALLMLTTAIPFAAAQTTANGLEYEIQNGGAIITNYTGTETDLVIPDMLGECPVTTIGDDAFQDCKSLKTIHIPASVTTIGQWVFVYCDNLEAITVDKNSTAFSHQDGVLFNKDKTTLICYPPNKSNTKYAIPQGVESVGIMAFCWCERLTQITIPDGMKTIEEEAFYHCTGITKITIPDSVTRMEGGAFLDCTNLTTVTLGSGVTRIEIYTFLGCAKLKNITIPQGVTYIGQQAFDRCESLTQITLPDSVKVIDRSAFSECINLSSVTFGKNIATIEQGAFFHCPKLTAVNIPQGIKWIGDYAFGMIFDFETGEFLPLEDFVIYGYRDTVAKSYAQKNQMEFVDLSQLLYGDVNGDKAISAADALLILKFVVGKEQPTGEQSVLADVSGWDGISAADALLVLKMVVGKIQQFPVEQ